MTAPARLSTAVAGEFKRRAPVREARQVFDEYLRMRASFYAPKSSMAGHIEALWLGSMGVVADRDSDAWRRASASESLRLRYARLSQLWGQLTPEEQRAIELFHSPVVPVRRAHRCTCKPSKMVLALPLHVPVTGRPGRKPRPLCDFCQRGGGAHLAAEVSVTIRHRVPDTEFVDYHKDRDGAHVAEGMENGVAIVDEGFVLLATKVAPLRVHDQIAEEMGIRPRQVRRLLSRAYQRARDAAHAWAREENEED